MAYSKLHSSIVNSSLWTEPEIVRILFITLLATCDKDGIVYGTRLGLNRLANIDPDEAEDAWDALLSRDPNSSDKIRAPENEGRRIEEVSGGFRLLNFAYYRGLRNDDDRRMQNKAAQIRHRNKLKVSPNKPPSAAVSHGNPPSSHTETDSDAEAEEKEKAVGSFSSASQKSENVRTIIANQELQSVNKRQAEIRGSYDSHQEKSAEHRTELKALKDREVELKTLLGRKY